MAKKKISLLIIFVCVYGSTESLSSNTKFPFSCEETTNNGAGGAADVQRIPEIKRERKTRLLNGTNRRKLSRAQVIPPSPLPISLNKSGAGSRLIEFTLSPSGSSSFLSSFFPRYAPDQNGSARKAHVSRREAANSGPVSSSRALVQRETNKERGSRRCPDGKRATSVSVARASRFRE